MKKFGLGLIGCGRIATEHLGAVPANADLVELIAVCDSDAARAQEYKDRFGAQYAYGDIDEMLKNEKIDGVILALPHHVHHDVTVQCLQAGKHVLVEKIMSNSYADSLDMVKVADEYGKTLMVGHTQRFIPGMQLAKKMVDEGKLGRVFNFTESFNTHLGAPKTAWWSSAQETGGGFCLPIQGVHTVDAAIWLMGRFPVRVYAQTFRMRDCWEGEDDFSAILTFADGATATMHITFDTSDQDYATYRVINGNEGTLIMERWCEEVKFHNEEIFRNTRPGRPHMEDQMREFVTSILENREPIASGRNVAPINAVIDAMLESARTGQAVDLRQRYPGLKYE